MLYPAVSHNAGNPRAHNDEGRRQAPRASGAELSRGAQRRTGYARESMGRFGQENTMSQDERDSVSVSGEHFNLGKK
jgi:hypothetical protein